MKQAIPTEKKPRAILEIADNKRAFHLYHILEDLEAGLVLTGTEVKSCRARKVQLRDAFAGENRGEFFLFHAHISPYTHGNIHNHTPERPRKLLLRQGEVKKLLSKIREKGLTVVPLKMYFKGPWAKLLIGLAKGKQAHDKRQDIAKKDAARDMQRAMSRRA